MLPDSRHQVLAIDTEAHTPGLKERGPRGIQQEHYAIGISVCAPDGFNAYYPVKHREGNTDIQIVPWLSDWVSRPDNLAIFAHAKFDIEMLHTLGIEVKCRCYDILAVDALIDENQVNYSLDAISKRYGLGGKSKKDLEAEMVRLGIVMPHNKKKPDWGRMREVPPDIVNDYAKNDAWLTLSSWEIQKQLIAEQKLERVAQLESNLIPVTWAMRLTGVPVNLAKAEQINIEMKINAESYLKTVREDHPDFEPTAARSMEKYVHSFGRKPPRTDTDEPSITNEWLLSSDITEFHDLARHRQNEKMRRDFVQAVVLEDNHKGLIHPSWFSTRGSGFLSGDDVNGTRSGRIACELPNLAQIPRRHKVLGPRMRGLFIPFAGHKWHKADYRSQEPRITLHYALKWGLRGAAALAERYWADPLTDYHQVVTDMVNLVRETPIIRDQGKTINLGILYGLGKDRLADQLHMPTEAANTLIRDYHRGVPFVKPLQELTRDYASEKGFINTELGRRRHFDLWEPSAFTKKGAKRAKALRYEEALEAYKYVKRAMTYKALNSAVQGSAAEQMKLAMVALHNEGLTPMVTLYDELGHSIPDDPAISKRICDAMENSLKFLVPHSVEAKIGNNWAGT